MHALATAGIPHYPTEEEMDRKKNKQKPRTAGKAYKRRKENGRKI